MLKLLSMEEGAKRCRTDLGEQYQVAFDKRVDTCLRTAQSHFHFLNCVVYMVKKGKVTSLLFEFYKGEMEWGNRAEVVGTVTFPFYGEGCEDHTTERK